MSKAQCMLYSAMLLQLDVTACAGYIIYWAITEATV